MIEIPVSYGELVDKLTILTIKLFHVAKSQQDNVQKEMGLLSTKYTQLYNTVADSGKLHELHRKLENVNRHLWDVEDQLRDFEAHNDFGPSFVEAARSVYRLNDQRAAIKREINVVCGSQIVEEKNYGTNTERCLSGSVVVPGDEKLL